MTVKYKLTLEFDTPEELQTCVEKLNGVSEPAPIDTSREPVEAMPAGDLGEANPFEDNPVVETAAVGLNTTPDATQVSGEQFQQAASEAPSEPAVDADGVPWDPRIHAKTKTKTAKGIWKRLRGVDDAVYESVLAELKGTASTPGAVNHSELLQRIVDQFSSGQLSVFTVADSLQRRGMGQLNEASGNPELIQELAEELGVK